MVIKMELLTIKNIKKSYKNLEVLRDISFSVDDGEFISVLGESGCGKTTLLRMIAGLEKRDSGSIVMEGKDVASLPTVQRNIGMVFQNYSLFPNMTVEQNITYALKSRNKKGKNCYPELAKDIIQKCELQALLNRYPYQLSGGQQQRTAIARSLVMNPRILLLDEPFSALDVTIRQSLRALIKQLQKEFHITMIYVTHDQEEAFTLSDRIIILHEGIIQQMGRSDEIFNCPQNLYVTNFTYKQLLERYENLSKIVAPSRATAYS